MVRILLHSSDPPLDGPQSVCPRFLSQPQSSYDFNIFLKSQKGGSGSGMALYPSPCASLLRRMDQVVYRPYPHSTTPSPERADANCP